MDDQIEKRLLALDSGLHGRSPNGILTGSTPGRGRASPPCLLTHWPSGTDTPDSRRWRAAFFRDDTPASQSVPFPEPLLALLGGLTAALLRKVPGAVRIGIVTVTALGVTFLPEHGTVVEFHPLFPDCGGALRKGLLPMVSALLG